MSQHFGRSSRPDVFCKKVIVKNFAKVTGKHLCRSLFLNEVACNFIKKDTKAQVFPVNFARFLRTPPIAASDCLKKIVSNFKINVFSHFSPMFPFNSL